MMGMFSAGNERLGRLGLPMIGRFAVVGIANTLADIAIFAGLTALGLVPALANLFSYSCGIALSYALNRRWTFRAQGSPQRMVKFALAMIAGLGLSTLLVAILATILPAVIAKILTVPVVFVWNFLLARYWVFN